MPLPIIDLRLLSSDEKNKRVEKISEKNAQDPFDLTEGPLVRATLLRADENESILLMNFHHIIF